MSRRWSRRCSHAGVVLAFVGALLGGRAQAQELRGTVREATTHGVISSAVLLLLDSAGTIRARNITDDAGRYRIAAEAWMHRLRVVRIGFRPQEVDIPPITGLDMVQLDVEMTVVPAFLAPVLIKSGAKCSKRSDRLAALGLLEQARAGLLATVVAHEVHPAVMVRLRYTSIPRVRNDTQPELHVVIDSSVSEESYVAPRPAADFLDIGFARDSAGTANFDGPDARTLLDDDFRDGYCFHLRDPDPARPHEVGLGFVAAHRKGNRIDIDGTLWVDTVARQLRDIRFEYVNARFDIQRLHPGGDIHFRELENGVTIVDRWSLRIPVALDPTNGIFRPRNQALALETAGGVIAAARWPEGLDWSAPLATVRAHLATTAGEPLPNRDVVLANTSYRGRSDSTGLVVIPRLLPGSYALQMGDMRLAAIGLSLISTFSFKITDSTTLETEAQVTTADDFVAKRCEAALKTPSHLNDLRLIGRVYLDDAPATSPLHWTLAVGTPAGWAVAAQGATSSQGVFEFCGDPLARNARVRITVQPTPDAEPLAYAVELRDRLTVVRVDAPLTPPDA